MRAWPIISTRTRICLSVFLPFSLPLTLCWRVLAHIHAGGVQYPDSGSGSAAAPRSGTPPQTLRRRTAGDSSIKSRVLLDTEL